MHQDVTASGGDNRLSKTSVAATCDDARHVAEVHYGRTGNPQLLVSERDQTYVLYCDTGPKILLKIAHPDEPPDVLEFQFAALEHIAVADPSLPVQRAIRTRHGTSLFQWRDHQKQLRSGFALSYLEGLTVRDMPMSEPQLAQLGALAARLASALASFKVKAPQIDLLWDIRGAARLRQYLPYTTERASHSLAEKALDAFENLSQSSSDLRTQVIHNDLNPHNILVDPATAAICGIIDFGDIVESHLVNDIAVTCSYLIAKEDDPLQPLCTFLKSYAAKVRLREPEIAALPTLIAMRMAMTVIISNWRAALFPQNEAYIKRNQRRALHGLRILNDLSPASVQDRLASALAGPNA